MKKPSEIIMPDSYLPSIYDFNYAKAYNNGIRYAIFDLDSTVLPFDDKNLSSSEKNLFNYIYLLGIKAVLCSSNFENRVKPVADELEVDYLARAPKPFVKQEQIDKLLGDKWNSDNTLVMGDSLYFDMIFAYRYKFYKVLIEAIKQGNKFKLVTNSLIQKMLIQTIKNEGFTLKKYYHGSIEK